MLNYHNLHVSLLLILQEEVTCRCQSLLELRRLSLEVSILPSGIETFVMLLLTIKTLSLVIIAFVLMSTCTHVCLILSWYPKEKLGRITWSPLRLKGLIVFITFCCHPVCISVVTKKCLCVLWKFWTKHFRGEVDLIPKWTRTDIIFLSQSQHWIIVHICNY